jgi:hypothetical protein
MKAALEAAPAATGAAFLRIDRHSENELFRTMAVLRRGESIFGLPSSPTYCHEQGFDPGKKMRMLVLADMDEVFMAGASLRFLRRVHRSSRSWTIRGFAAPAEVDSSCPETRASGGACTGVGGDEMGDFWLRFDLFVVGGRYEGV